MKLLVALVGLIGLVGAMVPSPEEVQNAIKKARESNAIMREIHTIERVGEGATGGKRCPVAMFHGKRKTAQVANDMVANDLILATKLLKDAGHTTEELHTPAVTAEFELEVGTNCPVFPASCDENARYRSADGTCNNLENTGWGSTGSDQIRILEPAYDDNISDPRTKSVIEGDTLPNPRLISNAVHAPTRRLLRSQEINLHVFQMGQFLDHDIIATPVQGEVLDCCTGVTDIDNCMPIIINTDTDPTFSQGYCMNFPRSAPSFCPDPRNPTTALRREQINDITSFIDASNVYGSTLYEQGLLRENIGGARLRTERGNRLPDHPDDTVCLSNPDRGIHCSLAGDHRVNVVPSLTAYHNLFVREHNRIVEKLSDIFPNSEELFQEARRIVIATMQKVVYSEFLPAFLSRDAIERFQLNEEAPYEYEPDTNPTVSNEFGIAYRFGHTWIPRTMEIFDQNFDPVRRQRTERTYFDPTMTYFRGPPQGLDGLTLWLTGENSSETDRIIENGARNLLFLDDEGNSFDLAALNIQRGRDHGLPSYTVYRKHCLPDSPDVIRFRDLTDHDAGTQRRLARVYRDPRDIDLFTGALAELPVEGGAVGLVMECLLAEQFRRLKFGDRFWYQGKAANFTPEQLQAIENYSMAKVLCNNYDFETVNFPNAFLATEDLVDCVDIPQLDPEPFRIPTGTPEFPGPTYSTLCPSLPTQPVPSSGPSGPMGPSGPSRPRPPPLSTIKAGSRMAVRPKNFS